MKKVRRCPVCGAVIEIEGKKVKILVRPSRNIIKKATCKDCKEWIVNNLGD